MNNMFCSLACWGNAWLCRQSNSNQRHTNEEGDREGYGKEIDSVNGVELREIAVIRTIEHK